MARLACGGTNADWVYTVDSDGDAQPAAGGTTVTFWSALTGGSQYTAAPDPDDGTGLVDGTGTPISSANLDGNGFLPEDAVMTPDGVTRLAIDASGGAGPRRWIYPNDPVALSLTAQQLAKQAQDTANAALSASGDGGGAVSSVNGKTGTVVLASGDVGALKAGAGNAVDLAIDDQFLRVDIDDENGATSPNRMEFAFQGVLTSWWNEYGEMRIRAGRTTTVPLKLVAQAGQANNLLQVEDSDRNPLGGFRNDGRAFGPNIGNAKVSAQTTVPASSSTGAVWIDTSQSPPELKVWDGSIWVRPSGAGGGTPPAAAPAFQAATTDFGTFNDYTATLAAGDTMLAFLAWHTTEAPTAPDGWTLVRELTATSARAGLWVADSSVTDTTWSWTTAPHLTIVILGYEQCSVLAHAETLDGTTTADHVAPSLAVGTAPATVTRFFFDKTTPAAAQSPAVPAGTTQRALEPPTGTAVCTVLAVDEEVAATGTAPSRTSTYDETSGNSGGFTVALLAPA